MFKTPNELKEFILWAKAQRIARIKVDKVEVEMSPLAFIDHYEAVSTSQNLEPAKDEDEAAQKAQAEEDEKLLYWSSKP